MHYKTLTPRTLSASLLCSEWEACVKTSMSRACDLNLYLPWRLFNLRSIIWKECHISQLIEQGFKVEFEAIKCWLKFFYSNKVIVEVIKEGRSYKLIGIVQSLVLDGSTKTKRNDLCHYKFEHVSFQEWSKQWNMCGMLRWERDVSKSFFGVHNWLKKPFWSSLHGANFITLFDWVQLWSRKLHVLVTLEFTGVHVLLKKYCCQLIGMWSLLH